MQTIYLKYGNYEGNVLTIYSPQTFVVTKCYERLIRKVHQVDTLRGLKYNNKFHTRSYWSVTISANELMNSTKMNFIKEFYKADTQLISFNGFNYIGVIIDGDEFDLQYIDDMKAFPEVTLKLYNIETL